MKKHIYFPIALIALSLISSCSLGQKITRVDDTREKLQLRLDTFFTQTKPVIDFYAEKGIVRDEEVSVAINRLGVDAAKDIVNYIKNK